MDALNASNTPSTPSTLNAMGAVPAVDGYPGAVPAGAAAVCAVAAVLLAGGRSDPLRRARLLTAPHRRPGPAHGPRQQAVAVTVRKAGQRLRRWLSRPAGQQWWPVPAAVLPALLGHSPLPLAAAVLAVPPTGRRLRARERRRVADRREAAVIELCSVAVGELRAGRQPEQALLTGVAAVGGPLGGLGSAAAALQAAARFGGDVPAALREVAALPGAEGLRGAAACWRVAGNGGAGLADGLDRVAVALGAERDRRAELQAQLAGPRSSALVLALLPAAGLLLGTAMGAQPLQVLLHTPAGLGCLLLGGLLEWAGLVWVARIVRPVRDREEPSR